MSAIIVIGIAAGLGLAIVGLVAWLSWLEQKRAMTAYLRRVLLRRLG